MADNLRQRRGKKSNGTAATETASAAAGDENQQPITPIDQLRSAQARLVISRDRTADLHSAWKNQLFLLSLLIVMVTIHQLHTSISSCIREIKDSNINEGDGKEESVVTVGGAEAMKLILCDSFCEILGVFISSLLAYFLALGKINTAMELDNWPYMVSSALVPVCLSFYFHSKQLGCMGGNNDLENSEEEPTKDPRHQFPAVVIYHTIVTVAFWFMKSGMQSCEGHVKLVSDSIRDFERMDKKMALKKQLKGGARKK